MVNIYKQYFTGCQHLFKIFIISYNSGLKENWFFVTIWRF